MTWNHTVQRPNGLSQLQLNNKEEAKGYGSKHWKISKQERKSNKKTATSNHEITYTSHKRDESNVMIKEPPT
jgi:hypothetical protein